MQKQIYIRFVVKNLFFILKSKNFISFSLKNKYDKNAVKINMGNIVDGTSINKNHNAAWHEYILIFKKLNII